MDNRRTSHTLAIICMFMAMNDVMELANSHLKSRMARDSKVEPPMPRNRDFGLGVAGAAGGASLVSAGPEASLTKKPSLSPYEDRKRRSRKCTPAPAPQSI